MEANPAVKVRETIRLPPETKVKEASKVRENRRSSARYRDVCHLLFEHATVVKVRTEQTLLSWGSLFIAMSTVVFPRQSCRNEGYAPALRLMSLLYGIS
jgi:hypothetical protein